MNYAIFIDDERTPEFLEKKFPSVFTKITKYNIYIVRNKSEFCSVIKEKGVFPKIISFDHDLGLDHDGELLESGMDIAKHIVNCDLNSKYNIPIDFEFFVHSQNPIGAKNIESYLNNYLKFKFENKKVV